jgi:hypothetical protein
MGAKEKKIEPKESYCSIHRRMLPIDEFYKSTNPNHGNGVVQYCKGCTVEIMKRNLKKYDNLESALWATCATLDIPFIRKVYERLEDRLKNSGQKITNYIGVYLTLLSGMRSKSVTWDTFGDTDVPMGEANKFSEADLSREEQVKHLLMLWGEDFSVEELGFLEWKYGTYTNDMSLTQYQASRYRDLCLCELVIHKNEDVDSVNKAMNNKSKIAKDLGIDQFTIDKEKTDAEKIIENDIYMMEKYEPAEYYADKDLYKDYMYIGRDWKKYVLRPIRNLIMGSKDYEVTDDSKYGDDDE